MPRHRNPPRTLASPTESQPPAAARLTPEEEARTRTASAPSANQQLLRRPRLRVQPRIPRLLALGKHMRRSHPRNRKLKYL